MPWGVDKTMNGWGTLETYLNAHLARRLSRIPASNAAMEAELLRVAAEVWDVDALLASIDRYEAQLEAMGSADAAQIATARSNMQERPGEIQELLADSLPAGDEEMSGCYDSAGWDHGDDNECPEDFDPSEPCEEDDKCTVDGQWYWCDDGVWVTH